MTELLTDQEGHLATARAMWQDLISNPLDDGLKGILADFLEDHSDTVGGPIFSCYGVVGNRMLRSLREWQQRGKEHWPTNLRFYGIINKDIPLSERQLEPSIGISRFDGLLDCANVTIETLPLLVDAVREFPIKRVEMQIEWHDQESDGASYTCLTRSAEYRLRGILNITLNQQDWESVWHLMNAKIELISEYVRPKQYQLSVLSDLLLDWARYNAGLPLLSL